MILGEEGGVMIIITQGYRLTESNRRDHLIIKSWGRPNMPAMNMNNSTNHMELVAARPIGDSSGYQICIYWVENSV